MTTNGAFTSLVSFRGTNGSRPAGNLTLGPDCNFYGVTRAGGANGGPGDLYSTNDPGYGFGTVFRVSTNGVLTRLASFNGTNNGSFPSSGLTFGSDGALYGTTPSGGSNGAPGFTRNTVGKNVAHGTFFRVTTNGLLTRLLTFYPTNGAHPQGALVFGSDGNFYGTTSEEGGSNGLFGTIFQVATNGALNPLMTFNQTNGAFPMAGLIMGLDGKLYGTTMLGGESANGTVFSITTNGAFESLASFSDFDGTEPLAGLALGADGILYGTTFRGGTNCDCGTVFNVTTNGAFTSLVSFGNTNGAEPASGMTLVPDGSFYGTTFAGGSGTNGTIFRFASDGSLTSLFSFNNTNGAQPESAPLMAVDGALYGTTSQGGTNLHSGKRSNGTVYRLAEGNLTTLVSFNYTNGAAPDADLTPASDGSFYGTTAQGGSNGFGAIYDVTTNGILTSLLSFSSTNGAYPEAGLIFGPDGNLYGTTSEGGTNYVEMSFGPSYLNCGTVFKMTPGGQLTLLSSLDPTNGLALESSLSIGPDGSLFCLPARGPGTNSSLSSVRYDYGTVINVATNGGVANVTTFTGVNGANSYGRLILAGDGNFYGTTSDGGSAGAGVIFRLGNPPYVARPPAGVIDLSAMTATFTVSAAGGLPLTYQWQKDGIPLQDGAGISGSSRAALTVPADSAGYTVVISNKYGAFASPVADLLPSQPGGSIVVGLQVGGLPGQQTNSVTFLGITYTQYVIQFTTNLATGPWFDLSTNIATTNGFAAGVDATATNAQRFYRVKY